MPAAPPAKKPSGKRAVAAASKKEQPAKKNTKNNSNNKNSVGGKKAGANNNKKDNTATAATPAATTKKRPFFKLRTATSRLRHRNNFVFKWATRNINKNADDDDQQQQQQSTLTLDAIEAIMNEIDSEFGTTAVSSQEQQQQQQQADSHLPTFSPVPDATIEFLKKSTKHLYILPLHPIDLSVPHFSASAALKMAKRKQSNKKKKMMMKPGAKKSSNSKQSKKDQQKKRNNKKNQQKKKKKKKQTDDDNKQKKKKKNKKKRFGKLRKTNSKHLLFIFQQIALGPLALRRAALSKEQEKELLSSKLSGQRRGERDHGADSSDDADDNIPLLAIAAKRGLLTSSSKQQQQQPQGPPPNTPWQDAVLETITRFGGPSGTVAVLFAKDAKGDRSKKQPTEILVAKIDASGAKRGKKKEQLSPSTLAVFDPGLASLRNAPEEQRRATERRIAGAYERAHRIREQALAQRRMAALRANDPEEYVRHLQTAKWSSLLSIMDRTHSLMLRIGAQLESKTNSDESSSAGAAANNNNNKNEQQQQQKKKKNDDHLSVSDAFRRFQAYVCSANDEYKLIHKNTIFVEKQPDAVVAPLFPHQLVGLRFLASLHGNNINGILADEPGVGKTLQTLAFFAFLLDSGAVRGMHLVIAPLSIVREWTESIKMFVPSLRYTIIANESEYNQLAYKMKENNAAAASATTTYPFDVCFMALHRARNIGPTALQRIQWHFIVVDEAHKAVSNPNTATARAINAMPFHGRLVLTGTPLNADVQELWSLLQFINPDIFCAGETQETFDEVFRKPFAQMAGAIGASASSLKLEPEERDLVVMRLQQILRPFVLRRTKLDIDATLQMTYHSIVCPLSALQVKLIGLLRGRKVVPILTDLKKQLGAAAVETDSGSDDDSDDEYTYETDSARSSNFSLDSSGFTSFCSSDSEDDDNNNNKEEEEEETASPDPTKPEPEPKEDKQQQKAKKKYGRGMFQRPTTTTAMLLSICNHPFMLDFLPQLMRRDSVPEPDEDEMVLRSSGKLCVLDGMLQHLALQGRKAVVFSHFLDTIDLLENHFVARRWGERFVSLTGNASPEERAAGVAQFRDDPQTFIFLLSMKAGGCGLNLQSADTVILYDRDYTATNEEQALSRVFRMGQKNVVRAVYLMTKDDCEQRVAGIALRKDRPRKEIIEGGTYHVKAEGDDDDDDDDAAASAAGDGAGNKSNADGTKQSSSSSANSNDSSNIEEIDCSDPMLLPQVMQSKVFGGFLRCSVPRGAAKSKEQKQKQQQQMDDDDDEDLLEMVDESTEQKPQQKPDDDVDAASSSQQQQEGILPSSPFQQQQQQQQPVALPGVPYADESEIPFTILRVFAECEQDEKNTRDGILCVDGARRAAAAIFDDPLNVAEPDDFEVLERIMAEESDCDDLEEALDIWRKRMMAKRRRGEDAVEAARRAAEKAGDPVLNMDAARAVAPPPAAAAAATMIETKNNKMSNNKKQNDDDDADTSSSEEEEEDDNDDGIITTATNKKKVMALLKPKTIALRGKQKLANIMTLFPAAAQPQKQKQQQQKKHAGAATAVKKQSSDTTGAKKRRGNGAAA